MPSPLLAPLPEELIEEFLSQLPTRTEHIVHIARSLVRKYGLKVGAQSAVSRIRAREPERYSEALKKRSLLLRGLAGKRPGVRDQGPSPGDGYTVFMTREQLAARGIIKLDK